MFTIACVQLNSNNDVESNIAQAEALIKHAAKQGAHLVTLPENATIMDKSGQAIKDKSPLANEHPAIDHFQKLAKSLNIWLIIGSIPVSVPNNNKLANRCFVFNNTGKTVAEYDKMHLFNATPKPDESYQESHRYLAGDEAVLVNTPWAKIGLSICYDVRFSYLFRKLAQAGAQCIVVPSAFAYTTGIDHWHILLRARAIETGCYIIAPAQCGHHPGDRRTFGHSLIVDPWGQILAEAGEEPGVIISNIDTQLVADTRKRLPSLEHDKDITRIIEC